MTLRSEVDGNSPAESLLQTFATNTSENQWLGISNVARGRRSFT
jgi:hypothetical protein